MSAMRPEPVFGCGEPKSSCPCRRIFLDCPAPECGMYVEPVLGCSTGHPYDTCDIFPNCNGAETWLERKGREIDRQIVLENKGYDLIAARMGATGRSA